MDEPLTQYVHVVLKIFINDIPIVSCERCEMSSSCVILKRGLLNFMVDFFL